MKTHLIGMIVAIGFLIHCSAKAQTPVYVRPVNLNIVVKGGGGVRVFTEDGKLRLGSCDTPTCTLVFPQYSRVKLVAVPKIGWDFSEWQNICYMTGRFNCVIQLSWHLDAPVKFVEVERLSNEDAKRSFPKAEWIAPTEMDRILETQPVVAVGPNTLNKWSSSERNRIGTADWVLAEAKKRNPELADRIDVKYAGEDERGAVSVTLGRPEQSREVQPIRGDSLSLEPQVVQLINASERKIGFANSLQDLNRTTNLKRSYEILYNSIQPAERVSLDLAAPSQLPLSLGEMKSAIQALNQKRPHLKFPPYTIPPAGMPSSCGEEEGFSNYSYEDGHLCNSTNTSSIKSKYPYPLKYYQTCVKNQGRRGTCTAFATTAAIESRYAFLENQWKNLSEQQFWYHGKTSWAPEIMKDGLLIEMYHTYGIPQGHRIPYEIKWPYNTSRYRKEFETTSLGIDGSVIKHLNYLGSCSYHNYDKDKNGEWVWHAFEYVFEPDGFNYCSESSSQARIICTDLGPMSSCVYASPNSWNEGFGVKTGGSVWDHEDLNGSISTMKTALQLYIPVVIHLDLTEDFMTPYPGEIWAFRGFVKKPIAINGKYPQPEGGHAMTVVGFISDEEVTTYLGQSISSLTDYHDPEGYFITKNSWGDCWGDRGYAYIPVSYFKKYMVGAVIYGDVIK